MRRRFKFQAGILCMCISVVCCTPEEPVEEDHFATGYVPVYGAAEKSEVKWKPARTIQNPGKIYVYGPYLLINEIEQGIHVYDNSNDSAPQALGFIQLLGNTDMAIKDGLLYADQMGDLLQISISNFSTLKEEGRLPLQQWALGVPPPPGHYFECVDADLGLVVSWKKAQIKNPDCYAIHQ